MTTVLEVASGTILKQIKVGGEPEGVDLSPDGRVVYVTSENDNQVFAIDTERLEVIKAIDVGPRPRSTGFLPDGSRAFVSAENGASVDIDRHQGVQGDQAPDVDARHAASDGRERRHPTARWCMSPPAAAARSRPSIP